MRWCKGAHRGHKRKGSDIHNLTFAVKIIRKFTFPKNGELIKPCDTISLNVNLAKYREGVRRLYADLTGRVFSWTRRLLARINITSHAKSVRNVKFK